MCCFGAARIVETPDIATVLDPGLPPWLAAELKSSTPRLLKYYATLLGSRSGPRPMLMATWAGPTPGKTSMGGSVLPGLVLMAFEGDRMIIRDKRAVDYVLWFIAHESAHFWLGQTVDYDSEDHAWMMEGGADLLAARALAAEDRSYDPRIVLNEAIAKCVALAANKPVNRANERSEHAAYYACGTVFGLVAEAVSNKAVPGSRFAGFWRRLIADNRADGIVSQVERLAALNRTSGDPTLAAGIRRIAEIGVANPRREILSLFQKADIAFELREDGRIQLK